MCHHRRCSIVTQTHQRTRSRTHTERPLRQSMFVFVRAEAFISGHAHVCTWGCMYVCVCASSTAHGGQTEYMFSRRGSALLKVTCDYHTKVPQNLTKIRKILSRRTPRACTSGRAEEGRRSFRHSRPNSPVLLPWMGLLSVILSLSLLLLFMHGICASGSVKPVDHGGHVPIRKGTAARNISGT